VATITTQMP